MKQYLILKISTGEEVIGETESELNSDEVNLENPFLITYEYNEYDTVLTRFRPYMLISDEKLFTFSKKYIIHYSIPSDSSISYYKKMKEYIEDQDRMSNKNSMSPHNTIQ